MGVKFSDLKGLTIAVIAADEGDEQVTIRTACGREFLMHHEPDCCEVVEVHDICGDLADIVGVPILLAEEVTHENENPEGIAPPEYQDSFTWTFYRIGTINGTVVIRWHGNSNGYYSESVDFMEITSGERTTG